jgi:hypothetical protein
MDRRWITGCTDFTTDHEKGVQDFLAFLQTRYAEDEEILCPCLRCLNNSTWTIERIGVHLLVSGMATTYTRWINHGKVLEDMFDDDVNVQDNVILRMWIMQLHRMVVIRKRSRKTNTYRVWRMMKAL